MSTVLICLRGRRVPAVLDIIERRLHPSFDWLILHVIDSAPGDELRRALGYLPGRGERLDHVRERMSEVSQEFHDEVRAEVLAWLARHDRRAETLLVEGHPEHEILRVARDYDVSLIAIGDLSTPGPHRLPPVVQFVVDHAPCDVLLIR